LSCTQRDLSLIIQAFRHSALGKLYSLAAIESLQQRDGGAAICCASSGSPGKGAKTDQNVWPLPRFNNFRQHECFDDSRFCQIFSFGGNYEISVETIFVETILVETNIFWWKLILFGGN
jgi:hypothetical protein